MTEILVHPNQTILSPSRVALRPEEISPHVIVHAMDFPSVATKVIHHFGANQAGGACDEKSFSFINTPELSHRAE